MNLCSYSSIILADSNTILSYAMFFKKTTDVCSYLQERCIHVYEVNDILFLVKYKK